MITNAGLLAAVAYFVGSCIKDTFQINIWRPITVGPLVGLLGGDLATGVKMGCLCEAIYMGTVPIGGARAANGEQGTIFATALAIASGASIETAMSLAVIAGVALNPLNTITTSLTNALEPVYHKLALEGKEKQYVFTAFAQAWGVFLLQAIVIYAVTNLGEAGFTAIFNKLPKEFMNGLNVASNCLVVVGLALTAQCIWTKETPFWILLGFILFKHVGLGVLSVALLGVIIAYFDFLKGREKLQAQNTVASEVNDGGDLFG